MMEIKKVYVLASCSSGFFTMHEKIHEAASLYNKVLKDPQRLLLCPGIEEWTYEDNFGSWTCIRKVRLRGHPEVIKASDGRTFIAATKKGDVRRPGLYVYWEGFPSRDACREWIVKYMKGEIEATGVYRCWEYVVPVPNELGAKAMVHGKGVRVFRDGRMVDWGPDQVATAIEAAIECRCGKCNCCLVAAAIDMEAEDVFAVS